MAYTDDPNTAGRSQLFRRQAVEARSSLYGSPVGALKISNWVLLGLFLSAFVVATIFLAMARYTRKETVVGTLEPVGGALSIVASRAGAVTRLYVGQGDQIEAGGKILAVRSDPEIDGLGRLGDALRTSALAQGAALAQEGRAQRQAAIEQKEGVASKRAALKVQRARLQTDLALQRQRLDLNIASLDAARPLREKGFFSELQFRQRQEQVVIARQGVSSIEGEVETIDAALAGLAVDERKLETDRIQAAARLDGALAAIDEKRTTQNAEGEVVLTAPRAGRVAAIQARAGAAVNAGDTMAIVVADGAPLQAELWAPSSAVGFLRVGDEVRLMYDAFPYQRYGVGRGHVSSIATAPTEPNGAATSTTAKQPLYRVVVKLDGQAVQAYGKSWPLFTGARLTADLVLDSRTFFQMLVEPFLAYKRRAA